MTKTEFERVAGAQWALAISSRRGAGAGLAAASENPRRQRRVAGSFMDTSYQLLRGEANAVFFGWYAFRL